MNIGAEVALGRGEDGGITKERIGLVDCGVGGEEESDDSGDVSLAFWENRSTTNRNRKFSRRLSLQGDGG